MYATCNQWDEYTKKSHIPLVFEICTFSRTMCVKNIIPRDTINDQQRKFILYLYIREISSQQLLCKHLIRIGYWHNGNKLIEII